LRRKRQIALLVFVSSIGLRHPIECLCLIGWGEVMTERNILPYDGEAILKGRIPPGSHHYSQERPQRQTVKSRKQEIAIGLSEARREGKKVPKKSSK
jgi:Family of unknown function (DUF6496)